LHEKVIITCNYFLLVVKNMRSSRVNPWNITLTN
jgi:hypothetical protein